MVTHPILERRRRCKGDGPLVGQPRLADNGLHRLGVFLPGGDDFERVGARRRFGGLGLAESEVLEQCVTAVRADDVDRWRIGRGVDAADAGVLAGVAQIVLVDFDRQWLVLLGRLADRCNRVVGRLDVEGLSVVSFNANGIQLAPAAGRIVRAQLVDDRPSPAYDAVSIARFDGYDDSRPDWEVGDT